MMNTSDLVNERESLWTLINVCCAFVGSAFGALIGAWVGFALAQRTAYERVMGEEYARRRLQLIEQLIEAISRVADILDHEQTNGQAPLVFERDTEGALAKLIAPLMARAPIYLSQRLVERLGRYATWLKLGGHALVYDVADYETLTRQLVEAAKGKHEAR